jgi:hypothetical protein
MAYFGVQIGCGQGDGPLLAQSGHAELHRTCPLLAQSGHAELHRTCPLLTQSGHVQQFWA